MALLVVAPREAAHLTQPGSVRTCKLAVRTRDSIECLEIKWGQLPISSDME
jgi:hypothetical protein